MSARMAKWLATRSRSSSRLPAISGIDNHLSFISGLLAPRVWASTCAHLLPEIQSFCGIPHSSFRATCAPKKRPRHDHGLGFCAPAIRHPASRSQVVSGRAGISLARPGPLATRKTQGCTGHRHRSWPRRFQRWELRAWHCGESLPSRLPRCAYKPAELRWYGSIDAHLV